MSASKHTSAVDGAYTGADYARGFPAGYEHHFWHRARLQVVLDALGGLGVTGRVLDIGCGPGRYVEALRERGYDAIGCDPGDVPPVPSLAGRVFTRTDCESLPADLRATVEIALLLDVLEHVPDPGSLVEDVRRILPALRALVITVPARPELWSDLDRRAGHRRRFRLAELSAVVIGAGYVVTDARYLFRLLYPAAWLGRWRPRSMHAPRRPGLHAVLGGLLVADARWLPAWLPGSSALCVARTARAVADRPA